VTSCGTAINTFANLWVVHALLDSFANNAEKLVS